MISPKPRGGFDAPETYAQARLRLGVGGVSAFIVLALIMIATRLPHALFTGRGGGFFDDASLLALWLAGLAIITLPLEFLGGVQIPQSYGRKHLESAEWFLAWLKGSLVLLVILSFVGTLIVLGGRLFGRFGATGMFGMLAAALIATQDIVARLVGNLRSSRVGLEAVEEEVQKHGVLLGSMEIVESNDESFTGGISGLPSIEHNIIPLAWVGRLEPRELAILIARRTVIIDRGLRALGLIAALGWVLVTFALASALPGSGVGDVAGFLQTTLWFTVLNAAGLLLLPTPSRAATIAADAWIVDGRSETPETLDRALVALDELGDRELERPALVERWFHPVASVVSRREAMQDPKRETAPWHVARAAVLLGLVGFSPLARLVHSSVGKPDLWIYPPTDG